MTVTKISIRTNVLDALGPFGKKTSDIEALVKKYTDRALSSSIGAARFYWNKLVHQTGLMNIGKTLPFMTTIGRLDYYVGRDEKGILRGGNLHWSYLQGICDDKIGDAEKYKSVCLMLAKLPGNVAFSFKADPKLRDAAIIRAAFKTAGFTVDSRPTFLYKGNVEDGDPVAKMKSDARTKINAARRDLEITDMSVEDFFAFYRDNLDDAGKKSHFCLNIDQDMFYQGLDQNDPQLEIFAVRRKSTDSDSNPHPFDAAVACSRGKDGYYKLMRVTYRYKKQGSPAPHKHANKLVVVEAMRRATALGLTLDTDGFTPGGGVLYRRFGVFDEVVQDDYNRRTIMTLLRKCA